MAQELYEPQVPYIADQDNINRFRPAQKFEGNKAGLYAGEAKKDIYSGLGQALAQGGHALDMTMKNYIQNTVHQQADPIQEAYTKQLEDTFNTMEQNKAQPKGTQALGYADGDVKDPMWNQQDKDLPPELTQNLQRARTLQDAREYGKIPYTYYLGSMNELAKSIRSQWPGYRQEIDSTFHEITGHPIGNAYMMSLISDIQAGMAGKDRVKDKLASEMVSVGVKEQSRLLLDSATRLQNGDMGVNEANALLADRQNVFAKAAKSEAELKLRSSEDEGWAHIANKAFLDKAAALDFETMNAALIDYHGNKISFNDMMKLQREGKFEPTSVEAGQMAQQVKYAVNAYKEELRAQAQNMKDKYGHSVYASSPDQIDKWIDKAAEHYGAWVADLADPEQKGTGAWIRKNKLELMRDDIATKAGLGDFGQEAQNISVMGPLLRRWAGDNVTGEFFTSIIPDSTKGFKSIQKYLQGKAVTQPDVRRDPDNGTYTTFQSSIDAMNKVQPRDPDTGDLLKIGSYREFSNMTTQLANPKTPIEAREGLAAFFFHPNNRKLLENFQKDDVDVRTGQPINARWTLFNQMTSEDVNKSVMKMPQQFRDWQQSWAEHEFKTTFSGSVQELSRLPEVTGVEVKYDKENNQLLYKFDRNAFIKANPDRTASNVNEAKMIERTVNEVNIGLRGLGSIEKLRGGNINDYLLKTMHDMGFEPGLNVRSNGTNLMQWIVEGILGGGDTESVGHKLTEKKE